MARNPSTIGGNEAHRSNASTDLSMDSSVADSQAEVISARGDGNNDGDHKPTVVGIGASAGGIEALTTFFDSMPADSGCAFVVVLHLDPKHESELALILGKHTGMAVAQIKDGMRVEPDHVYVIAPDTSLTLRGGILHMSKPSDPPARRHPVDILFASLAIEQRERAIAIVLSGTGRNGTEGLRQIRAEGGISLIQDPETARFDGMPRSAIDAGLADQVLAPEHMPAAMLSYLHHGYLAAGANIEDAEIDGHATIEKVLEVAHIGASQDFRSYKRSTLGRRIYRRLGLRNIETLDDYIDELRTNPDELKALVGDLMISVTGFFRDAEAWKALDGLVVTPLIAERQSGAEVRAWVSACSTGEEAYSMAMLITEHAEAAGKHIELKVFATDAQEDNLRRARDGVYPEAALTGFSESRLRRFFTKLDGSYQVNKELRDMVVFAQQNLLRDPPFSRLDIVSCRNFLIYLEPDAQQRIIALCHFALRPGGHLFLGSAETVGRHEELFETASKKWRIYRRLGQTRHDLVTYPETRGGAAPRRPDLRSASADAAAPLADLARRALLERFAPASVLIDQKGWVLYFHGTTRDYLEHPPGEPTRDLLTMARDGLAPKLRSAMRKASREKAEVTVEARIRNGQAFQLVTMTVTPLGGAAADKNYLLVSFAPGAPRTDSTIVHPHDEIESASTVELDLQAELQATRLELQNAIEHLETANEELKASNEEATSANEELQSTNEELETSKEELQSFNEELHTVNHQLQHKIGEQEITTDDLNNLLAGSETATLFLDTTFRIRWFAPATKDLFDLTSSDVGRPIVHFAQKFADQNLLSDAETVLQKLSGIEAEVLSESGRWYLRRMLPYRTQNNRIAGVVINFSDITDRKLAADATDRVNSALVISEERLRLALEAGRMGSWDLDLATDTSIRSAFHDEIFGYDALQAEWGVVKFLGHVVPEDRTTVELSFRTALDTGSEWNFECRIVRADGEQRWIDVRSRPSHVVDGKTTGLLGVVMDITERKHAVAHQRLLIGELNHRVKNTLAIVQSIASQTLGKASSIEEARSAFSSRLINLANAHDVLTRSNWAAADLVDIIEDSVKPHSDGGDRFRIKGPRLQLVPGAALAIAMALHELCTNATKYGALSTQNGHVDIVWSLSTGDEGRRLSLRWTESGGPPVTAPTRKGFGSRLIERALAQELSGTVRVAYEPTGVVCTIDAPLPDIDKQELNGNAGQF